MYYRALVQAETTVSESVLLSAPRVFLCLTGSGASACYATLFACGSYLSHPRYRGLTDYSHE
jgi:hypothetical protein